MLTEPYLPQEVDDLTMVFPAGIEHLLPDYDAIPAEFKNHNDHKHKWLRFQRDWFYHGLSIKKVKTKKGIDERTAMRHLSAIQGSYEPKHEHKEAAVAFLASLWFDDVKYGVGKANTAHRD